MPREEKGCVFSWRPDAQRAALTSSMAQEHNVLLAISGDYYGAQRRGYVIRNGVLYRETAASADLCIWADGSFSIIREGEEVGTAMSSNPPTALTMLEPLQYLWVVAGGRTAESDDLSLYELACFLQELGAQEAYNWMEAALRPCFSWERSLTFLLLTEEFMRNGR